MSSGKLFGTVGGGFLGYALFGSFLSALGGGILGYLLGSLYDCYDCRESKPSPNKATSKEVEKIYPMYG